ncbi:MAG: hypothetical protein U9O59_06910 [Actinomycetota bacterium]|nr:hypothetical protein [Actinomycetota bacterium]
MRLILIIFSFANIVLYYTAYAYFDNIISALAVYNLPAGLLNFLKFFILLVLGFMIGFLIVVSIKQGWCRNYFDLKAFLLVGCIPAVALLFYKTGLVNMVVSRLFNSDLTVSELAFYFFSRETIWAIWLGISIGASLRLKFRPSQRKFKHQIMD